ncbi:MAG: glycosyltransferase [Patescibacteria group bacterium]|nr:glycosyltransferase [Patescibacteria group bacterium]MDE2057831.1 glycosyltransferase [Patescibacteria group bacterium]
MKLLITTQAVDQDDPVLSFFHAWIEVLAARVESVEVICLKEGRHALPANVRVHSLGKERGRAGKLAYSLRFLRLAWRLRRKYDAVFVHMNEEYVILGGLLWRALGKRSALWRNFRYGSRMTPVAARLANAVCYTSPDSYTARFANAVRMPIGIDTERFAPPATPPAPDTLLFFGRLDEIKRPSLFLDALRLLDTDGIAYEAAVYGDPTPGNEAYAAALREQYRDLSRLAFCPGIPNEEAPRVFGAHAVYINLSPSGLFDKTIGEAMAAGALVVTGNSAVKDVLPPALFVGEHPSAETVAEALKAALALPRGERQALAARQRAYIEREHALALLAGRITGLYHPRRVAFLINRLERGGAERVFVDDANRFVRAGYAVSLFVLYGTAREQLLARDLADGVVLRPLCARSPLDLAAAFRLARMCARSETRAVISTLEDANILGRLAVLFHWRLRLFVREANDVSRKRPWQRMVERALDWTVACHIAVTDRIRDSLAHRRTLTIHNAVDVPATLPLRTHRSLPRILAIGRLTEQKDFSTLIAALGILSAAGIPYEARIVGTGAQEPGLKAEAERVRANVSFLGDLSHESALHELAEADVFALSSRWEGCPNVVLEAMAYGLPVVATNVGGVPELVQNGATGLLVPPQDPQACAEALARVLSDGSLRSRLGEAGYIRAREHFNSRVRFDRLRSLIED